VRYRGLSEWFQPCSVKGDNHNTEFPKCGGSAPKSGDHVSAKVTVLADKAFGRIHLTHLATLDCYITCSPHADVTGQRAGKVVLALN
jgi:hypothetical protein